MVDNAVLDWIPYGLLAFGAIVFLILRRYQDRLGRWGWLPVDLLPLVMTFGMALISVYLFQERSGVRPKYDTGMVVASAALVTLLPALCWGRWRAIVAGVVCVLLSFIAIGDLVYLRFFGNLLPLFVLSSASQLWDVRGSILALIEARDLNFLAFSVLGVVLAVLWPRIRIKRPRWAPQMVISAALVALCLWQTAPIRADLDAWMSHRFSWKVFEMKRWLTTTGFIGAHVRDFARIAREYQQREPVTSEQFAQIKAFHDARRQGIPDDGFGAASGANVLMIQVEAMQEWVVHAKVRDQLVMPFAHDLMGKSLYFSNIWDQTGASPTSDCEYAVFNSQHPLARGAVAFRRQDNDFVPLPRLLSEQGYTTLSAHAYRRGMWNRAVLHPRYGFQQSLFTRELGTRPRLGWGLADREFFQRVVPHLEKLEQPWFSFLITLTSHHPYTYIPGKLRKLNTAGMGRELAGYLHSMRYVDDSLRELFSELRRRGLLQDTLVVLFGDHDSKLKFDEKTQLGAAEHLDLSSETLEHLAQRHWQTKKIPLWLTFPDERRVGLIERVGGQIDIGPTVMYYLGVPTSPSWLGQPLLGDTGEVVRLDGSAVGPDVLWAAETRSCHDRQTGATLDEGRCSDLVKRGAQELEHSWTVTLENLATRLHEADAERAAH